MWRRRDGTLGKVESVGLGNGMHDQPQLELYGAVLDAAYLYNKYGAPLEYLAV
jgi:hypothetical protein